MNCSAKQQHLTAVDTPTWLRQSPSQHISVGCGSMQSIVWRTVFTSILNYASWLTTWTSKTKQNVQKAKKKKRGSTSILWLSFWGSVGLLLTTVAVLASEGCCTLTGAESLLAEYSLYH